VRAVVGQNERGVAVAETASVVAVAPSAAFLRREQQ
jgi:hypothetical protein